MNWNTTKACCACFLATIAGFGAGKLAGGPKPDDEAALLIERSKSGAEVRDSGERSSRSPRASASGRMSTPLGRLAKVEGIMLDPIPTDRQTALLSLIDSLAPSEFGAVMENFHRFENLNFRSEEHRTLLVAWAKVDLMAALAYVNDAKGRYGYDFTDIANETFLPEWTANDPEAAIAWAKANPAADGTSPYMAGIIKTLAGTDPARATELLEELAANRKAGDPLREAKPMYEELLRQGLEASISWLNGISNDALYQDAAYRLASDLYSRNSAVMAKWLVENERLLPDNSLGTSKGCISSAVMSWSMSDRDAAFAYYESMPEGGDRSKFFLGLFEGDLYRGSLADRENLLALIDRNPEYASDDMLARAATQLSIDFYKTPEIVGDSLSLIPLIRDENKRNDTYRDFIERWQRQDEEGAQRWINSGGFP